jgi:hypothetical protein
MVAILFLLLHCAAAPEPNFPLPPAGQQLGLVFCFCQSGNPDRFPFISLHECLWRHLLCGMDLTFQYSGKLLGNAFTADDAGTRFLSIGSF